MGDTKIWAHRGASAYAPENTLEAFRLAVEQQADGVELDVQLTKDGKVVVIHDETIDRVSSGQGYVKDYTLKELKKMSFNKLHPEYQGAKIPTLKEVLELLKPTDLTVNIELKTGIVPYKGIEKKVLKLVKKAGMEDRVIYSSFYHPSLLKIKKLNPEAKTGILYSDGWVRVPSYAKELGVDAIHPATWHMQAPKLLEKAKKKGLAVHVWTVNDPDLMKSLAEQGVDAIITNNPDVCRMVLKNT